MWALQHYTQLNDIKQVVINHHGIEHLAFLEFFRALSREWARVV